MVDYSIRCMFVQLLRRSLYSSFTLCNGVKLTEPHGRAIKVEIPLKTPYKCQSSAL